MISTIAMNYRIEITKESDGQYSATSPDLPGVFATGDSEREARHHLRWAAELYLAEMRRDTKS